MEKYSADSRFLIVVTLLAVIVIVAFYLAALWKFRQLRKRLYGELKDKNKTNRAGKLMGTDEGVWDKFLPRKLLDILGIGQKEVLPEKFLEEQVELRAGIMNIDLAGFQANIHRIDVKEVYRLINQVLACCIPFINKSEGSITNFQNAGVTALFTEDAEKGLNTAVSICEEMRKLPEKDKKYGQLAIGICYGNVMIGMVGHDERLSVLTLSSYTGLGRFLQKKAPKYNARILVSGSYLEQIPDFQKKYNCRFLGYIRMKNNNTVEKIYDVFDGDDTSVRNQKRKTKRVFEEGIKLFLEESYREARLRFIEVLKTDRHDRAAMEYVLLCDQYAGETDNNNREICIEEYE